MCCSALLRLNAVDHGRAAVCTVVFVGLYFFFALFYKISAPILYACWNLYLDLKITKLSNILYDYLLSFFNMNQSLALVYMTSKSANSALHLCRTYFCLIFRFIVGFSILKSSFARWNT